MLNKPKSYRDLVYCDQATFNVVDDFVTGRHPFPETGKTGLILYGPYGTGKTTLANLLPNDLELARGNSEGVVPHRFAIQSGENGPAVIQSIDTMTSVMPFGTQHYVILDEVDNLGPSTMTSLKGVMNVPGTVFLLTTNNLDKIDQGVISRSHLIRMTPPPPAQWLPICQQALKDAGVVQTVPQAALTKAIAQCNGDVRELATQLRKIAIGLLAAAPATSSVASTTP